MRLTQKLRVALRALLLKAGEIETDKGKLIYEGELEVGTEVFIERTEGEEVEVVPAPDGTYAEQEGGRLIDVEDGKVTAIRNAEDENQPEPEPAPDPDPAPDPAPDPDSNVEGAEEDPADENDEEAEESIEDRVARLEARLAELTEGIESLMNALVGLTERLEAVEAKVANLDKEPATDPADDKDQQDFSEQKPKSRLSYMRK